ncbi:MAG: carbohydrate porin [Gammaproteobacteria bacterium]|nr:carbohydrate porin [Gammaproteobacteria bacterium]
MTHTERLLALAALGLSLAVQAADAPPHIETRHGAIAMSAQPIAVEGGFTAVLQAADDRAIEPELGASFDLLTTLPAGAGKWVIYIEGNTSPRSDGASSLLGETNADAGSALDRDGNGRLQVSEAHYFHPLNGGLLVSGLLDVTSSLDSSEVANDETSQFLSSALVNNPTIGFPDYSLGVVYNREIGEDRGYSLALTSSHGLADNPHASYAQLLDVDADGKGLFAAAEGQWPLDGTRLHAGAWVNTADHTRLDGGSGTRQNYGLYLTVDGRLATGQWNLRAGLANDQVSPASRFLSAALETPLRQINRASLGLGVAYTGLSSELATPGQDDTLHAEAYLRLSPREDVTLTPALQWLRNSGFDASGATVDAQQLLLSLRLNYTF